MVPLFTIPLIGGCSGNPEDSVATGSTTAATNSPAASIDAPRTVRPFEVEPVAITADLVASGLSSPWALCFLPDGDALVTERGGQLRLVSSRGELSSPLAGLPTVSTAGQGGLLDLVPSPGFEQDRTLFLTFAEPRDGGLSATAVARAVLDGDALTSLDIIFQQQPPQSTSVHYGSRLAFDSHGFLFVTLGERGQGNPALDPATTLGKTVRIRADGSIPADNPAYASEAPGDAAAADAGSAHPAFAQTGALPEVWTLGHRNPQGIACNPWTGSLWISEHGARGGDEINRLRRGRNYGWPRITTSLDYTTGLPLGEGRSAPDVEPPLFSWEPVSPAPCGMLFYTGDQLPGWQGCLLVGMLAGKRLTRLVLDGDQVRGETRHLESLGERIRDVSQAPDGLPWFITDSGNLYRIRPS